MLKTILKLFVGIVLLIAIQACAPPIPATSDPNFINTAVAQTLAAAQTQTSQAIIPITGDESPTPTVTAAPTSTALTSTAIALPSWTSTWATRSSSARPARLFPKLCG